MNIHSDIVGDIWKLAIGRGDRIVWGKAWTGRRRSATLTTRRPRAALTYRVTCTVEKRTVGNIAASVLPFHFAAT